MALPGFVPTLISRYASTSLLVYDILLTLDVEATYVWTSKWTLPQCMYLIIRYFGLIAAIFSCCISPFTMSDTFCSHYDIFTSTWLLVSAGIGDVLLTLRVLALLKDKRNFSLALKILYGAVYLLESCLLLYYLATSARGISSYTNNLGCVIAEPYDNVTAPFIKNDVLALATLPVVVLNVVLLISVFYNLLPAYRRTTSGARTSLLTAVLRDGAMYFVILTTSTIFVSITPIALYNRPWMLNMSLPWFMAIGPLASARLFLNLRATAAKVKRNSLLVSTPKEDVRRKVSSESASSASRLVRTGEGEGA